MIIVQHFYSYFSRMYKQKKNHFVCPDYNKKSGGKVRYEIVHILFLWEGNQQEGGVFDDHWQSVFHMLLCEVVLGVFDSKCDGDHIFTSKSKAQSDIYSFKPFQNTQVGPWLLWGCWFPAIAEVIPELKWTHNFLSTDFGCVGFDSSELNEKLYHTFHCNSSILLSLYCTQWIYQVSKSWTKKTKSGCQTHPFLWYLNQAWSKVHKLIRNVRGKAVLWKPLRQFLEQLKKMKWHFCQFV